jgi:hypothetical protein
MQMSKTAVVLELNSSHLVLLTDEGAFMRIPAKSLPGARYIGQQVDLGEMRSLNHRSWLSVAAACLLLVLVLPVFRPAPVRAWVTLDGSSSLEVLVDRNFKILEFRPLNSGAENFLADFPPDNHNFSALVDSYLAWSTEKGDSTVLVTSTASTGFIEEFFKQRDSDAVEIVVLELDPEARGEAEKLGVSAGRALFLAEAGSQGVDISVDDIRESNPFIALSAAGADVEKAVSSTADPGTQVGKIKDLPRPEPDTPGDSAANDPEPPGPDADSDQPGLTNPEDNIPGKDSVPPGLQDTDGVPPGQQDKDELPPGQQDKDELPPGQQDKDELPPGQQDKDELPPGQQDKDELPPGQQDKDGLPPGQQDKEHTPPGQEKIKSIRDKYIPRFQESKPLSWKEEKTGPPFKKPNKNDNNKGQEKGNNGKGKGK